LPQGRRQGDALRPRRLVPRGSARRALGALRSRDLRDRVLVSHSLVIPAYNEARLLPRLLDSVDAARSRYRGSVQVIVADNASTDATAAIATARGCEVARVEKRRIAAARNGGARLAGGDSVCFIDADSSIHPETFNAIDQALARSDVVGGATGVFPERWSIGIVATWMVMMPIVWLTGMDTGVVFCR